MQLLCDYQMNKYCMYIGKAINVNGMLVRQIYFPPVHPGAASDKYVCLYQWVYVVFGPFLKSCTFYLKCDSYILVIYTITICHGSLSVILHNVFLWTSMSLKIYSHVFKNITLLM